MAYIWYSRRHRGSLSSFLFPVILVIICGAELKKKKRDLANMERLTWVHIAWEDSLFAL